MTTRRVPIGPSTSIRQPGRARHSSTGASSRPRCWEASIIATNGPLPDDPYFVARNLGYGIGTMDFDSYALDANIYDEMLLPDGTPRAHCHGLYEALTQLSSEELGSIQERVTRSFSNAGITFTVLWRYRGTHQAGRDRL